MGVRGKLYKTQPGLWSGLPLPRVGREVVERRPCTPDPAVFTFHWQPEQQAPRPEGRAFDRCLEVSPTRVLGTSSPWNGGEDQAWGLAIQ